MMQKNKTNGWLPAWFAVTEYRAERGLKTFPPEHANDIHVARIYADDLKKTHFIKRLEAFAK